MRKRLARPSKIVAVLTFAIGVALFANATSKRPAPARSFVVTYTGTEKDAEGKYLVKEIEVRIVKSTGEQKYSRYNLGAGMTTTTIATLDDIYEVKPHSLEYYNSMEGWDRIDQAFRSASMLKSHPEFAREEQVAGMKTYVHKVAEPDSTAWVERYYAAETGAIPLKTVLHSDDGGEYIVEAISVQFRDVPDVEVKLPALPVRFDRVEKQIKEYRDAGNARAADALSKRVETAKQKHSSQ